MNSNNQTPNSGKQVWKVIFKAAITILTALGAIFGLESCGVL